MQVAVRLPRQATEFFSSRFPTKDPSRGQPDALSHPAFLVRKVLYHSSTLGYLTPVTSSGGLSKPCRGENLWPTDQQTSAHKEETQPIF